MCLNLSNCSYLVLCCCSVGMFTLPAQAAWQIGYFSDDYHAVVKPSTSINTNTNNATEADANQGYDILVYHQNKPQPVLIQTNSDLTDYDFEVTDKQGKILPNIGELPYGHQSILIYTDMNFDGIADFALKEGNYSCYGGPSFQVYLADSKGSFNHSAGFTSLAQTKCGMFSIDTQAKQLHTMTKSGAGWHEYNTYNVINNSPNLIIRTTEETSYLTPSFWLITTDYYPKNPKQPAMPSIYTEGDDRVTPIRHTVSYLFDSTEKDIILSFQLNNKAKTVVIYRVDDQALDYALLDTDVFPLSEAAFDQGITYKGGFYAPKTEFSALLSYSGYLPENLHKQRQWQHKLEAEITAQRYPMFTLTANTHLSFSNAGVRYTIIDTPTKLGVQVLQNGKRTFLAGELKSKQGSLQQLHQPITSYDAYGENPQSVPLINTLININMIY